VYAPSIPTVRSVLVSGDKVALYSERYMIVPSMSVPVKFMASVSSGNPVGVVLTNPPTR